MGEVYLAEDTRLGRKVAIKVLPAEFVSDPERLARFEQEARAAAARNHPHIAAVFDVGQEEPDDGSGTIHYMVQEHLEGETLREPLKKGALPLKKALGLATEVTEALAAAYSAGIIHRDLKPENIFITKEGHAKVLDFGLAKLTEVAAMSGSNASMSPTLLGTVAGQVMGTAGYMAPEQAEGDTEIDHRADLFAFGAVLYEMSSGTQPFVGKNALDTLHRIANANPELLSAMNSEVPSDLQRIVTKCLAKDTTDRYQHADDLLVDLRGVAKSVEAGTARPVGAAHGAASLGQRHAVPLPAAVAGAVVMAAFTALCGASRGRNRLPPISTCL